MITDSTFEWLVDGNLGFFHLFRLLLLNLLLSFSLSLQLFLRFLLLAYIPSKTIRIPPQLPYVVREIVRYKFFFLAVNVNLHAQGR
jgi:hypothetical protein